MASLFSRKSFEIGALVQSGRQALIKRDFAKALSHFEEVAKKAPSYIYKAAHFSEGIWTYVGRTQYATGHLQVAQQSLGHALTISPQDHLARLYLGMTLIRGGGQERGVVELKNAMQGLYDWIEDIVASRPFEAFWDPNKQIRNELQKTITMVTDLNADRSEIIASAEWLGQEIEEEIERARRDESRQYQHE